MREQKLQISRSTRQGESQPVVATGRRGPDSENRSQHSEFTAGQNKCWLLRRPENTLASVPFSPAGPILPAHRQGQRAYVWRSVAQITQKPGPRAFPSS